MNDLARSALGAARADKKYDSVVTITLSPVAPAQAAPPQRHLLQTASAPAGKSRVVEQDPLFGVFYVATSKKSTRAQRERVIKAARAAGASEDLREFEKNLRRIATVKRERESRKTGKTGHWP